MVGQNENIKKINGIVNIANENSSNQEYKIDSSLIKELATLNQEDRDAFFDKIKDKQINKEDSNIKINVNNKKSFNVLSSPPIYKTIDSLSAGYRNVEATADTLLQLKENNMISEEDIIDSVTRMLNNHSPAKKGKPNTNNQLELEEKKALFAQGLVLELKEKGMNDIAYKIISNQDKFINSEPKKDNKKVNVIEESFPNNVGTVEDKNTVEDEKRTIAKKKQNNSFLNNIRYISKDVFDDTNKNSDFIKNNYDSNVGNSKKIATIIVAADEVALVEASKNQPDNFQKFSISAQNENSDHLTRQNKIERLLRREREEAEAAKAHIAQWVPGNIVAVEDRDNSKTTLKFQDKNNNKINFTGDLNINAEVINEEKLRVYPNSQDNKNDFIDFQFDNKKNNWSVDLTNTQSSNIDAYFVIPKTKEEKFKKVDFKFHNVDGVKSVIIKNSSELSEENLESLKDVFVGATKIFNAKGEEIGRANAGIVTNNVSSNDINEQNDIDQPTANNQENSNAMPADNSDNIANPEELDPAIPTTASLGNSNPFLDNNKNIANPEELDPAIPTTVSLGNNNPFIDDNKNITNPEELDPAIPTTASLGNNNPFLDDNKNIANPEELDPAIPNIDKPTTENTTTKLFLNDLANIKIEEQSDSVNIPTNTPNSQSNEGRKSAKGV